MTDSIEATTDTDALKCPECRATLKHRRSRNVDRCEMVCGGCGRMFDVCDSETAAELHKAAT